MEARTLLLTIAYDGSGFAGWQRQPGRRTVQGELEDVLSRLCRTEVRLSGCSRTDAGVHALDQKAVFSGVFGIPTERLPQAANRLLNRAGPKHCPDLRILAAEEVEEGFQPRFRAAGKQYVYRIRCAKEPDLFRRLSCYQLPEALDAAEMRRAAALLEGEHDFRSFMAAGGSPQESTVRTLFRVRVEEGRAPDGAQELQLSFFGNGFLYNMVRILSGTLVEAGQGKRPADSIPAILAAGARSAAGHTAPPEGLTLARIYFDRDELLRDAQSGPQQ